LLCLNSVHDGEFTVRGFVVHIKNQQDATVYKNFISDLYEDLYFELHTAHNQKPKTALAASGFAYVERVVGRVVAGRCQMQQRIKILFQIYMKLNIFRATHRLSLGA
jgi:hypothetical protein